ncbi:putative aldouronate transport system substrate-binding protein [Anaerobacterium chartisolvens]|uniref:Putative aldouronate transport system substrate-binding protein n=1 Tax=Anaerobacterium chartisolvens TaxID=1297424 RepID=A0A369BD39_9FIRM|nr:extracellular solute-binding protein [Anaerobacterium chartisolvens]RCX19482.1 putative aldouronate transport system substrate-binding protein [Anaerobacterium chartisolvens]
MQTVKEISLILVLSAFFGVFSGCSPNNNISDGNTATADTSTADSKLSNTSAKALPIVEEPITLKVWMPYILQSRVKSNSIMKSNIELEKRTGIKIQWIEPPAGQAAEAYNLMIASRDLPDLIEDINAAQSNDYSYPGGYDKAIDDGVILKLNDLIDKYAPNYKKIINSDPITKKLTITDKGNIYGIAQINADISDINRPIIPRAANPGNGLVIRRDWLDDLGLEIPVTLDDWYTVLKAFKEKKGAVAPLLINKTGAGLNSQFLTAFGTAYTNRKGQEFYQENGKVKFGPIEPGYKKYLTFMNKWYEEGLIDKFFMVRDADLDTFSAKYMPAGKAGATNLGFGWVGDYYSKVSKTAQDPDFYLQPVNPPVSGTGEQVHFRYTTWSVGGFTAITTSCKYPEAAIKWLDYVYSKEGILMTNWGIEGTSYNMREGKPVIVERILNDPEPAWAWMLETRFNGLSTPGVADEQWMNSLLSEAQLESRKYWGQTDNSWNMPPLYRTYEEEAVYTSGMSDIIAYVDDMTVKFIMGSESVSNYDAFVSEIKNMGIDQIIKIQQNALDRYNKR